MTCIVVHITVRTFGFNVVRSSLCKSMTKIFKEEFIKCWHIFIFIHSCVLHSYGHISTILGYCLQVSNVSVNMSSKCLSFVKVLKLLGLYVSACVSLFFLEGWHFQPFIFFIKTSVFPVLLMTYSDNVVMVLIRLLLFSYVVNLNAMQFVVEINSAVLLLFLLQFRGWLSSLFYTKYGCSVWHR